jgi:hypothetical protein|tara:strand:- start:582 stop:914 length:333 start_codon:yes stop_codon:yes gene_type:complete
MKNGVAFRVDSNPKKGHNKKMKNIKKMKNGALYYNTEVDRVERLVGNINTQRVWTVFHKEQPVAVSIKHLRIANPIEVNGYRRESLPSVIPLPTLGKASLPPLPRPLASV